MFRIKRAILAIAVLLPLLFAGTAAASIDCSGGKVSNPAPGTAKYCCGSGSTATATSIDFGCQGKGSAVLDMMFAIIHLLSDGVGLIVIASLIAAGIQFTASSGDPQNTAKAVERIRSNVIALLIFFFAYAILNYVVPGSVLQ